jgi:very-short-patch-repair endonuclease
MDWGMLASAQAGVITHRQLEGCGLSIYQIRGLRTGGALQSTGRGVYAVRGAAETDERRLFQAALATGGVLGFDSACYLWGLQDDVPHAVTVIVPQSRRISPQPDVRLRRRSTMIDELAHCRGLSVTTRAVSFLDHVSTAPIGQARVLFDRGIQRGWIVASDVFGRLESQRLGNGQLRELAASIADGAAAESERRLHQLLRQHQITGWVANAPVVQGGFTIAVLDLAFHESRLAIEVDGMAHHVDPTSFQRDRKRQNDLVALGWRVLRFTWWDISERPQYVVGAIRSELARSTR